MVILLERLVLLPVLMYEQFLHHIQINTRPNMQLFWDQKCAHMLLSIYFRIEFFGIVVAAGCICGKNVCISMNKSYPTAMYESISAQMNI